MVKIFAATGNIADILAGMPMMPWETVLTPVSLHSPKPDDALWVDTLIADIDDNLDLQKLAEFIDKTPLYRHALELELDKTLFRLEPIQHQLPPQFMAVLNLPKGSLKNRGQSAAAASDAMLTGIGLYHMFLEHLDTLRILQLLHALDGLLVEKNLRGGFRSVWQLLNRHPDLVAANQAGYMFDDNTGAAFLGQFLTKARRTHAVSEGLEDSVAMGRAAAMSLHGGEPQLHLENWLHLDRLQARICSQLDVIFRMCTFTNLPSFARTDMFSLMQLEAMKQVHAERMGAVQHYPIALTAILDTHQQGLIDPILEKVIGQFLSYGGSYAGQAGFFVTESMRRAKAFS